MDNRHGPAKWSRTALPGLQDMPPPQGFPPVRYVRNLPQRGPTPAMVLAVGTLVSAFGFYRVIHANRNRR